MGHTFTEFLQIASTLMLIGGGAIVVILLAFLPDWKYKKSNSRPVINNNLPTIADPQQSVLESEYNDSEDGVIKDYDSNGNPYYH